MTQNATDITATLTRPSNDEVYGSDWNWAEEATAAWLATARAAGITPEVASYEVPNLNSDAAIVAVDGARYVLTVGADHEVRAVEMADVVAFDVVEVTDDNAGSLGYGPTDRGLAVQRNGEWIAWADDLDHATRIIGERADATVTLDADPNHNYGDRWVAVTQ